MMGSKSLVTLMALCMVVSIASGRSLKQQQVTAQQLTAAIREINGFAQVPDTSAAVASSPGYANLVATLQGPAAEIVQVANILTSPSPAPATEVSQYTAALRAYGYQSGKDSLSSLGQGLYNAYEAITNYLSFSA